MRGLSPERVVELVEASQSGDASATDRLLPLIYDELRARAAAHLRQQAPGHLLQPTALVHEVYVRLAGNGRANWAGRTHVLAVASKMLRRVLIDHARARKAAKRGGGKAEFSFSTGFEPVDESNLDADELDDALQRLAQIDGRAARVVEMRFFAGMSDAEIAVELKVTARTVHSDWTYARAWLSRDLSRYGTRR